MPAITTGANAQFLEQYWKKEFITEYENRLVLKQLGLKGSVPSHTGTQVNWFQFSNAALGAAITESTDPAFTSVSATIVSATLAQVGQEFAISDIQMRQATENFMSELMKRVGRSMAETEDLRIYGSIFSAGGMARYGGTAAFRNSLADNSSFDLSIAKVRRSVATLENANALPHPLAKQGSDYVGVINPYAKFDVMGDSNWTNTVIYTTSNIGQIAMNSIGTTYGVTWFETAVASGLSNSGSASTDVLQTYILGGEFFGISEAMAPEVITKIPSPASAGNFYGTVAWKYLTAYLSLHTSGMVRIETSTSTETRST